MFIHISIVQDSKVRQPLSLRNLALGRQKKAETMCLLVVEVEPARRKALRKESKD